MPISSLPTSFDYTGFRRTFLLKKRYAWARPSIWLDSSYPATVDRSGSEDPAILLVLEAARQTFKLRSDVFTPADRLEEARRLADYAADRGVTVTRLVAAMLLISNEHARRLLIQSGWKRCDVEENDQEFIIQSRAKFDERRIRHTMMGIRKPCPGASNNPRCEKTTTSNHDLCWPCHEIWHSREEMPDWMLHVVRDDQREYRRQAIEALYHLELRETA